MPKNRPPYPALFKQQILELVRSGRSVAELAREFEPPEQTISTPPKSILRGTFLILEIFGGVEMKG